jgi:cell division protease FtsH
MTFAQALARSCGVPLIVGSYAQWQTSGGGHLGDLLRAMAASFDAARKAAPSILFIDEIDSFYARQHGDTRNRDWWANVVGGLLQLLDGVEKRDGVVVVGATNHPELVDPAIIRGGRLDRTLEIGLPDQAALAGILRVHLRDDLAHTDLMLVAMQATGATGADAERWVRGPGDAPAGRPAP